MGEAEMSAPLEHAKQAREAWEDGFSIVAHRLNEFLAAHGIPDRIPVRRSKPKTSLSECRNRCLEALKSVRTLRPDVLLPGIWQGPMWMICGNPSLSCNDRYELDQNLEILRKYYSDNVTARITDPVKSTASQVRQWFRGLVAEIAGNPPMTWDEATESRNTFIYDECMQRTLYKQIIRKVKQEKDWDPIGSPQGIKAAAIRYAKANDLPEPPKRQRGRPKSKK